MDPEDKKRFLQILSDHSDVDELKDYDEIENLINRYEMAANVRMASKMFTSEDFPDHYEVTANLKGFTKDQISVTCKDTRTLNISVQTENSTETRGRDHIRRERSFAHRHSFHEEIDTKNVKAAWKDGILKIELPKWKAAEKNKMRQGGLGASLRRMFFGSSPEKETDRQIRISD